MGLMKVIYILCIIHYKYCIVSQIPNNNPKQTNENKTNGKTNEGCVLCCWFNCFFRLLLSVVSCSVLGCWLLLFVVCVCVFCVFVFVCGWQRFVSFHSASSFPFLPLYFLCDEKLRVNTFLHFFTLNFSTTNKLIIKMNEE